VHVARGILPVNRGSTGVSPVMGHGQDGHPTGGHGPEARATGSRPGDLNGYQFSMLDYRRTVGLGRAMERTPQGPRTQDGAPLRRALLRGGTPPKEGTAGRVRDSFGGLCSAPKGHEAVANGPGSPTPPSLPSPERAR